jgi:two-component system, NtrC family, response regulator HydG
MGGEPLRILVVDDDRSIRLSMAAILMLDGYEVETAGDGQKALAAAARSAFDIIFIDFKMPGMSGVETFLELKKLTPAPLVVLMTAYTTDEMNKEALKLGIYAIQTKPFNVDEVIRSIVDSEFSARNLP